MRDSITTCASCAIGSWFIKADPDPMPKASCGCRSSPTEKADPVAPWPTFPVFQMLQFYRFPESLSMFDKTHNQNESLDPFDPKNLRLTDTSQIGVQKVQTVISCGKPNKQQFVRVHPSEEYRLTTALFTDEAHSEAYLVAPPLWDALADAITPTYLFTGITKTTGNVFLWPVKVPDADGRANNWHVSQLRAAELAMSKWIRMQASRSDGCYDVFEAKGNLPDPEWPEMTFREILKICFQDRLIESLDHPILKQLRGEM
jgi:hypothetical protein